MFFVNVQKASNRIPCGCGLALLYYYARCVVCSVLLTVRVRASLFETLQWTLIEVSLVPNTDGEDITLLPPLIVLLYKVD